MSTLDNSTTDEFTTALFGTRARRASVTLYVQEAEDGSVAIVGGSRRQVGQSADLPHPLRYGSARTHQLIVGEIIVRPTRLLITTDELRGYGLAGLITSPRMPADLVRPGRGELLWSHE